MRKIALVSEHASPLGALGGIDSGGQNVYVAEIATQLAQRGWAVDVFTRADAVGLPQTMRAAPGVRLVHVPAGPANFVRKEDLLPYMGEFARFVEGYARRERYDLLHANFFMSGLVAAEVKARLGTPFAITFHALGKVRRLHQGDSDGFPDERFEIEDRIVTEADRIVAECPADAQDLLQLYDADPSRIATVPCGFDPEELWPVERMEARARMGLRAEDRVILQLGRMVPRKGVETVIRALPHVVDRGIEPLLVIAGGESVEPDPRITPEIGRLEGIARECGVADLVRFIGSRSREQLRDAYSAANVFATVPWYEPFGITPLEAMACGIPVVGSDVGGIRSTVIDGETGYLVPPKDPPVLGERLSKLLAEDGLARRFGDAGRQRVLGHYTWAEVARSLDAVFEDVISPVARTVPLAGARHAEPGLAAVVTASIDSSARALLACGKSVANQVAAAAGEIGDCLAGGGKVLVCGNGGSAADAQHFAAELVCRFRDHERSGLPVLALGGDAATVTAWSNDVHFEDVFARQVEAFGKPGDVLVAISTSGRSPNVTRAMEAARRDGLRCVAFLGRDGGDALRQADVAVVVPCDDTPRIQEVQMTLLHALAEIVENTSASTEPVKSSASSVSAAVLPVGTAAEATRASGVTGDARRLPR